MVESVLWAGFGAVPIVIGLVQAVKAAGFPARFAGVLSYGLGVAGGVLFAVVGDGSWALGIGQGLWVGLGASGLYSGIKHAANGPGSDSPRSG